MDTPEPQPSRAPTGLPNVAASSCLHPASRQRMPRNEAEREFTREWESRISLTIKDLLEAKHLYQTVRISEPGELAVAIATKLPGGQDHFVDEQLEWAAGPWSLAGPEDPDYSGRGGSVRPSPHPRLPDLRLFCQVCARAEPYNPLNCQDCATRSVSRLNAEATSVVQVFVASFLCQGCKSFPEFFFIRREGLKLTLSGRSPIEYVGVPKIIPKHIASFVSKAIVAHQTGHTLAGLFYLRTAIEQWTRSQGYHQDRVDTALESYGQKLPLDFRSRFPSLLNLYGTLSESLHTAKSSSQLFERSLQDIEAHFDARRIFELDNS